MTRKIAQKAGYIAITGSIGSGKSHVCRLLQLSGVEVYDCDTAAKRLINTSKPLQDELQRLVGKAVFVDGELQKAILSAFILASKENAQAVNEIVHPAVAADLVASGTRWFESAILYSSGFDRRLPLDYVICVSAPLELRIKRIMQRDGINHERATSWLRSQMPQEKMLERADFNIVNDGRIEIDKQIEQLFINLKTRKLC